MVSISVCIGRIKPLSSPVVSGHDRIPVLFVYVFHPHPTLSVVRPWGPFDPKFLTSDLRTHDMSLRTPVGES